MKDRVHFCGVLWGNHCFNLNLDAFIQTWSYQFHRPRSLYHITQPLIDLKTADSLYHGICQRASIEGSSGTERLSSLRALSTDQLLTLIPPAMTSHSSLGFTIETSSNAIWSSTSVTEILKTGKWSPHVKSVMLGVTKDESTMFTSLFQAHTPASYMMHWSLRIHQRRRGMISSLVLLLEFWMINSFTYLQDFVQTFSALILILKLTNDLRCTCISLMLPWLKLMMVEGWAHCWVLLTLRNDKKKRGGANDRKSDHYGRYTSNDLQTVIR